MCRQQDLIRVALHEAVDQYSTSRIESELLRHAGGAEARERADALTGRLESLCATLKELLALHRSEHGC